MYLKKLSLLLFLTVFCTAAQSETKKISEMVHEYNFYVGTFDVIDKEGDDKSDLFGIEHANDNLFRDTILGFVASIQVSINDMVRIGDWISFDKFGADGDVIEINLATVKVQNFDNTITTIPTYALISDSFKNWRGMDESKGRRIKRALNIRMESVKNLNQEEIIKLGFVDT